MKISIRLKFILVFTIIFIISFILSISYMKKTIEKNNKEIIDREMIDLMMSSREDIKQYFFIKDIDPTTHSFIESAQNIGENLSEKNNCNTEIYSIEGNFLYSSTLENAEIILKSNILDEHKDIELAQKDSAATTTINKNEKIYINFSFPLYINGNFIGIIRSTKDYTSLHSAGIHMTNMFTTFFGLIFAAVFIGSLLISNQITKPIFVLKKSLNEVANGNYETSIFIRNKDEIGELAKDFASMKNKIKNQIKTIEEDKEKLILAEKHKQDFFNNVTHELKTPLTCILGYAQILEEENFSDDKMHRRAIKRINSESERLLSMVVELIEISKNKTSVITLFEKIDISPLILKTCDDMSLTAKKHNMEIKSLLDKSIYIYGNKNKIKELIINILDNAIKYGEDNSEIKVTASKKDLVGYLEIENTGKGIPSSKLTKIFEPFYRVNNTKEKGSCGLGLFICKNIVEELNGKIFAESIANELIKIIIQIPLIDNNLATTEEK